MNNQRPDPVMVIGATGTHGGAVALGLLAAGGLANVGALVAAVLGRREEHLSRRIEVAGDDPTPAQMARALPRG